ncbi:MAG: DUF3373 family protein [Bdellovibrio sp.]|nr:DUF3373 family protein [Bdellovibrio sp.]
MFYNFKKIAVAVSLIVPSFVNAQTMSVEDRLSELEANQSLNIFSFGGYLDTRYDDIDAEQTSPAQSAFKGHTQHLRLRSGLNVNAKISPKLNFFSTFATSKYFNVWQKQNTATGTQPAYLADAGESRAENGSQVYLEKAYADYMFSDSFTFSFGRLPTMDGPPSHLSLGKARMGTYPSIGYNSSFDGIAFSYNKAWDDQSFAARVLYTPFTYNNTSAGKLVGTSPEGLSNVVIAGSKTNSVTPLTSVMFEYGIKNTGVANNINVMAMAYQTGDLAVDGAMFNAGAGAGSGLINFKVGGQVVAFELTGIMGSGFDLGVTSLQSKVDNSGTATIPGVGAIYGFGASSEGESLSGNTTLVSGRYKWNNTFIGGEYLMGGKNVFNYDPSTEVANGFYGTPGTGTHAYILHKLTPELGLRVGYMKQEYKSTPFSFGASGDTDRKITTVYTNLRLDF